VTTRFVTDPTFEHAQVIAEVAADGSETHYTYGLTRLARHRSGASAYLHSDALGSLWAATRPRARAILKITGEEGGINEQL
jgi:hypothetical protein